jgi:hypothetical protein
MRLAIHQHHPEALSHSTAELGRYAVGVLGEGNPCNPLCQH